MDLTQEQVQDVDRAIGVLKEMDQFKGLLPEIRDKMPEWSKNAQAVERLQSTVNTLQRARLGSHGGARSRGKVSDEAARAFAAHFILHTARSGKLEAWCPETRTRDFLLSEARTVSGISTRTALTTSDIGLPVQYGSELIELIAEFGVARQNMRFYPMAGGTNKPPRMGTRPAFGSIAMSAPVPEKSPTLTFASLESHKLGGIVILPNEIDDQSIVPMGQFLAQYAGVEFARAEDTWAFLADGSATYEQVKGVCKIASENSKVVQLGDGLTKPSDVTLDDLRALRGLVSTACLTKGGKYYLNATWEARLRKFNNNQNDPYVFIYRPDGTPILDGFPIVWTEVLTPYGTTAAADSNLAVFGNLNFWWFGQRRTPRIDMSSDVYFANDQLAARCLEEIDFDYNSLEAASALKTAAE
jgi:HK97 family phage major capsid protein